MKTYTLANKLFAEFVGTMFLLFAGVGIFAAGSTDLLTIALAHGLAIAVAVTAIGHVSGGHLNPAVTAAVMVCRRMKLTDGLAYMAAQLSGAVVGALAVAWGFNIKLSELSGATPALADGLKIGNGMLLEAFGTFLLVWVVFGVAIDQDGAWKSNAGLPIGLAIVTGILMVGAGTGGALNPARWFGTALLSGTWIDALVWIIGPIAGGVIAGASYMSAIKPRVDSK